jgi:Heterokaryon incompatibility protein (HET)
MNLHSAVTTNLEKALRDIRLENDNVYIWVDAICINQRDVEERNIQVARMWKYLARPKLCTPGLMSTSSGRSFGDSVCYVRSPALMRIRSAGSQSTL